MKRPAEKSPLHTICKKIKINQSFNTITNYFMVNPETIISNDDKSKINEKLIITKNINEDEIRKTRKFKIREFPLAKPNHDEMNMNNSTNSLNQSNNQYDPFEIPIKKKLRVFPLAESSETVVVQNNTNKNQYDPLEMPCKAKTSEQNPIEIPVSPNYNSENDEFYMFNEFNVNQNTENVQFSMLRSPLNGFTLNQSKESDEFSMLRSPLNGNSKTKDVSDNMNQFFPKTAKNDVSSSNDSQEFLFNKIIKPHDTNWFFERKEGKNGSMDTEIETGKEIHSDQNKVLAIFSKQVGSNKENQQFNNGNSIKEQPKSEQENLDLNLEEEKTREKINNQTKIPIKEMIFNNQLEFYRQLQRERIQRNLIQSQKASIFGLFAPPPRIMQKTQEIIDLEDVISIESD